jgi:uncharacterized protein
MNQLWKSPNIIIGPMAKGENYFNRPNIVKAIWNLIAKNTNALVAAPRRLGKSSVLFYMSENCPDKVKGIFRVIQGVNSEQGFYQFIFELLYDCLGMFQKANLWLNNDMPTIKKMGMDGVEFVDTEIDYVKEINKVLPKLAAKNLKIVLFLDELPEVLNFLYKHNKAEQASGLLDTLRAWRLNWNHCLNFVLAGSVGIHHVVKKYEGRTADLNDLQKVPFEAFTDDEAKTYIKWATEGASVQYDEELNEHLLSKIKYYLPYFINLMLDEIDKEAQKNNNPAITEKDIDKAFEVIIKNSDYFKEWKNRLDEYFNGKETEYLVEILTYLAHNEVISKRKIHDLAQKHQLPKQYVNLIDGLEKDGYIVENGDNYVFISPFLAAFWKRQNPFYDAN